MSIDNRVRRYNCTLSGSILPAGGIGAIQRASVGKGWTGFYSGNEFRATLSFYPKFQTSRLSSFPKFQASNVGTIQ